MLPKIRRLSRRDFLLCKTQGKLYKFPHFSAIVHNRSSQTSLSRFAVVTSAKLHKSAVVRNQLRRHIYESPSILNCKLVVDIIIYPRSSMLNLKDDEFTSSLSPLLQASP